jgi:hypothetical protein
MAKAPLVRVALKVPGGQVTKRNKANHKKAKWRKAKSEKTTRTTGNRSRAKRKKKPTNGLRAKKNEPKPALLLQVGISQRCRHHPLACGARGSSP